MRNLLFLSFLLASCQDPSGKDPLPKAQKPKETAELYINALRNNQCEVALALVSGTLRESYHKMIEAKNLANACDAWRYQYLPYDKIEFSHEEDAGTNQKKIWMRLLKDNGFWTAVSVDVEQKDGRWWIIGV